MVNLQAGKAVDPAYYNVILGVFYIIQEWTEKGEVPEKLLKEFKIT